MMLILLVTAVLLIITVARTKIWVRFATRKIYLSRIALSLMCALVAIPLVYSQDEFLKLIPGKFSTESPNLSATAIKLGVYGLFVGHEVRSGLPPEQQDLADCIRVVSFLKAQPYMKACGNDHACFERIPTMTKGALIAEIKDAQAGGVNESAQVKKDQGKYLVNSFDVCRKVDVNKL